MRRSSFLCILLALASTVGTIHAQSTIDTVQAYGWAANVGWTNWRASTAGGAVIGEYVCSGFVYAANVGWINLGSGAPANGIQYGNGAAGDFGVNFYPTNTPGTAILRGFAYGANVGWINFEGVGNPAVNLVNGQLSGYAYSANCGWINLGTSTAAVVKTNGIAPGVDTDGDGIADAWEYTYFGGLNVADSTTDRDGDGVSDLQEYQGGTSPLLADSALRLTSVARTNTANPPTLSLTFNSTTARLYRIETTSTLVNPTWTDAGLGTFLPDGNTTTTRQISGTSGNAAQFFRVRAVRLGL